MSGRVISLEDFKAREEKKADEWMKRAAAAQKGIQQRCGFCGIAYVFQSHEHYRPRSCCAECWDIVRGIGE